MQEKQRKRINKMNGNDTSRKSAKSRCMKHKLPFMDYLEYNCGKQSAYFTFPPQYFHKKISSAKMCLYLRVLYDSRVHHA